MSNTLLQPKMLVAWVRAHYHRRMQIRFDYDPTGTVMHVKLGRRQLLPVPIEGQDALISSIDAFDAKYLRPLAEGCPRRLR